MERHIRITVVSRSSFPGGEDTLTCRGQGLLRREGEEWHLRYTAHGEDGSALASDVRLRCGGASLRNMGAGYTLTLETGRRTEVQLPTPQGKLALQVETHAVEYEPELSDGRIYMDYTLHAAGEILQRLQLTMQLTDR